MLDWAARIEDLHEFLAREYDVTDTLAVEILLSALIPCPRTANIWITLETNWATPECDTAWFGFGGEWLPVSFLDLRGRGASWRDREQKVSEWLGGPIQERLFVEPEYEHYPRWSFFAQALLIQARALRLRTRTPRSLAGLNLLDQYQEELTLDKLRHLTQNIIKEGKHWRSENPPAFVDPPHFAHYVEMLEKLSGWFTDWRILVRSLAWLAVRHAYLFGREETGPPEDRILERIMRDSIPPWIHKAIEALAGGESKTVTVSKKMGLEERSKNNFRVGPRSELRRLKVAGVVESSGNHLNLQLVPKYRDSVLRLIRGEAFSPQARIARVS